jgi:hypothetical protein
MLELNRTTESLAHFIRLARRGAKPAASGGEKKAHRMAAAAVENSAGLDADAKDGYLAFLVVLWADHEDGIAMLEVW